MPYPDQIQRVFIRQERTARRIGTNADFTLGGNFNLFLISGGPIRIKFIFGHVVVACTGAVLVPQLSFLPTLAGAGTTLSAAAGGALHAQDVMLVTAGLQLSAITPVVGDGHTQCGATETEDWEGASLICVPGTILIVNATADATAVIDWYMTYIPLTDEARVQVL